LKGHCWKIKYWNIPKSLKEDLDLNAAAILSTLQHNLNYTENPSLQVRADLACKLVGSALHESASSVLSSPNNQPQHTNIRKPPANSQTYTAGKKEDPTPDAKTLRTEIQALRYIIAVQTKENRRDPQFATLKIQLKQFRKTLKQVPVYKQQNSSHLLAHAHEKNFRITPVNITIKTAWKLLYDYKGDDTSAFPPLPSQMHTIICGQRRTFVYVLLRYIPTQHPHKTL